jgi:hypothetical protein
MKYVYCRLHHDLQYRVTLVDAQSTRYFALWNAAPLSACQLQGRKANLIPRLTQDTVQIRYRGRKGHLELVDRIDQVVPG